MRILTLSEKILDWTLLFGVEEEDAAELLLVVGIPDEHDVGC